MWKKQQKTKMKVENYKNLSIKILKLKEENSGSI